MPASNLVRNGTIFFFSDFFSSPYIYSTLLRSGLRAGVDWFVPLPLGCLPCVEDRVIHSETCGAVFSPCFPSSLFSSPRSHSLQFDSKRARPNANVRPPFASLTLYYIYAYREPYVAPCVSNV